MLVEVPAAEFRAASLVSGVAVLQNVRLVGARLVTSEDAGRLLGGSGGIAHRIDFSTTEPKFDEGIFRVQLTVDVDLALVAGAPSAGTTVAEDDVESVLSVVVTHELEYLLPPDPPEEVVVSGFPAFAKLNGLLNGWPYSRAIIHQLCGAADITFVLPLVRIVPSHAGPDAENDETT